MLLCFAALKPKQRKKIKEKKQTVLKTAEELRPAETTLLGTETGQDNTAKNYAKRVKSLKKLKSSLDLGLLTEASSPDEAVTTNEPERSVVVASDRSSHVRRPPAKSDRNSGVVRIIDKSRHKQVQRTDNIEEALHLDVGVGSCQW